MHGELKNTVVAPGMNQTVVGPAVTLRYLGLFGYGSRVWPSLTLHGKTIRIDPGDVPGDDFRLHFGNET